jgi:two-component system, chemotaxis family, response regulator Rcp1
MTIESCKRMVEILLVEDNPDDAFLALDALQEGPGNCHVTHVQDGVEAMAFLRGQGAYDAALPPHLVLLDIYLPKKKGLEVLQEMKEDRILRDIPVIMMTSSSDPRDIAEALNRHAYKYISKPISVSVLLQHVQEIVRESKILPNSSRDELAILDSWIREFEHFG